MGSMIRRNMLPTYAVLILCLVLSVGSQVNGEAPANDASVTSVKDSCENFEARVGGLKELQEFHASFEQFALKNRNITGASETELICFRKGVLFKTVDKLSSLAKRLDKSREYVCTMEYAARLYRLHWRLEITLQHQHQHHLRTLMGLLVAKWMHRCTSSLNQRLMETEKRAPDAARHLNLILGVLRYQLSAKLARGPQLPLDFFVPVLESEQLDESEVPFKEGYQFKITKTQNLAFESARFSCGTLKVYFVNLLGSLGLVSSLGYPNARVLDYATTESAKRRQQDWLMASLVCQSLGTVSRISHRSATGKNSLGILVRTLKEADLSSADERDTTFAGFQLEETAPATTTEGKPMEGASGELARLRKLQLIEMPTRHFANAVMQYLDMNQPEREKLPYNLLGLEPPAPELAKNGDDDDDDDEDEDEDEDGR